MAPGLEDQERIFINKFVYTWEPVQRGDIVVFRYPRDPSKSYIKRVIGVAGDRVRIENGRVYVNGQALGEYHCLLTGRDIQLAVSEALRQPLEAAALLCYKRSRFVAHGILRPLGREGITLQPSFAETDSELGPRPVHHAGPGHGYRHLPLPAREGRGHQHGAAAE